MEKEHFTVTQTVWSGVSLAPEHIIGAPAIKAVKVLDENILSRFPWIVAQLQGTCTARGRFESFVAEVKESLSRSYIHVPAPAPELAIENCLPDPENGYTVPFRVGQTMVGAPIQDYTTVDFVQALDALPSPMCILDVHIHITVGDQEREAFVWTILTRRGVAPSFPVPFRTIRPALCPAGCRWAVKNHITDDGSKPEEPKSEKPKPEE